MAGQTIQRAAQSKRNEGRIGDPTQVFAMLPSEFVASKFNSDKTAFVMVVPDNGESAFDPFYKTTDKAGKVTDHKSKFVIADLKAEGGRGVAPLILVNRKGEVVMTKDAQGNDTPAVVSLDNGNHKGIGLGASLYIQAVPANTHANTIEEALAKPETEAQATVRALTAVAS